MKLIISIIILSRFFFACTSDALRTETAGVVDTIHLDCIDAFEILENGDTINRTYGRNNIKHGHWIRYVMTVPRSQKDKSLAPEMQRIKMEEGHYALNKKQGFWKFYSDDGNCVDSMEYKNGVPCLEEIVRSGN